MTYEIHVSPNGHSYIFCKVCGVVSYEPSDVRDHYCDVCHCFHDFAPDGKPPY